MPIPTAICLDCGVLYHGWALRYIPAQHCYRCGTLLTVMTEFGQAAIPELDSGETIFGDDQAAVSTQGFEEHRRSDT